MFEHFSEVELRETCRTRLESAERWLRRLVHDQLSKQYPDYLEARRPDGSRLIKSSIAKDAVLRRGRQPDRYPRGVDAFLTDELIAVICNPELYPLFSPALRHAFPDGRAEALTFLQRLIAPRNSLAHVNMLSLRQAEQIICYSGDVIDSIKAHYVEFGLSDDYNVPLIFRVTDNLGNSFERSQMAVVHDGGIMVDLSQQVSLRPGDVLSVELEVDPSFDPSTYRITWASTKPLGTDDVHNTRIVIPVTDAMVARQFNLQCSIKTDRTWHRMEQGDDDFLIVYYRILPPI